MDPEHDITTDPTLTWYNLENHNTGYTGEYGHTVDPHDQLCNKLERENMRSRRHTYHRYQQWLKEQANERNQNL